jgi:omega-amidase
MKISVIQSDIAWEDTALNFKNLTELLLPLYNKTDIAILPEMFNTGFSMNPAKFSETPDGETFSWMKKVAHKGNFGLCGSYMVRVDNLFYNRWVFVSPETKTLFYDKRHLFAMGGEDNFFSAGKNRLTFTFRDTRISPYICYDLRFPVWSRNTEASDLLIYSANWPESRRDVWLTLLKARAIENQCYVAASNRIGTDGKGIKYCGDSMIIDPYGRIIASANPNELCSVTGNLSLNELTEFRNKFPVLNDADDFTINIV